MDIRLSATTIASLLRFGRRRRMLVAAKGLSATFLAAVLTLSVVVLADYAVILGDWLRFVLSFVAYAVTGYVFYERFIKPTFHPTDLRELARMFEQRYPDLREEVLSAVELGQEDASQVSDSEEFREKLQTNVASSVGSLAVTSILPNRILRRWLIAVGSAIFVWMVLAIVPGGFLRILARAIAPFANIERVSRVQLHIIEPVDPEGLVPQGEPMPIVVGLSEDPKDVYVKSWSEDGKPINVPMQSLGNHRYTATLLVGGESLTYRIYAGDAVTKRYTVHARRPPSVLGFEKTYHLPEYTGRPAVTVQETNGDLEAIEGSTADLVLDTDQPIAQAEMIVETTDQKETVNLAVSNPTHLRGDVHFRTAATYTVHLVAAQTKFSNKFSPTYEIRVLTDEIPTAVIDVPADNVTVQPGAMVPLEGSAHDDVGLRHVVQKVRLNDGAWVESELSSEHTTQTIVASRVSVQSLGANPGDSVYAKLVATDLKGNIGESPVVRIRLSNLSAEEARKQQMELEAKTEKAIGDFAKAAQELQKQTQAAQTEYAKNDNAPAQQQANQQAQQQQAETKRLAEQTAQTLQEAQQNADTRQEMQDLTQMQAMLEQIRQQPLPEVQTDLQAAQQQQPKDNVDKAEKAAEQVAKMAQTLQQNFEQALALQEADRLAQELAQMAERQEQMVDQAEQNADQRDALAQLAQQEQTTLPEQQPIEQMLQDMAPPNPDAQAMQQDGQKLQQDRQQMQQTMQQAGKPDPALIPQGKQLVQDLKGAQQQAQQNRQQMQMQMQAMRQQMAQKLQQNGPHLMPGETGKGVGPTTAADDAKWGKLRSREARDVIETRKEGVAEDYRAMVGSYLSRCGKVQGEEIMRIPSLPSLACLAAALLLPLVVAVPAVRAAEADEAEWQKVNDSAQKAVGFLVSKQNPTLGIIDDGREFSLAMTSLSIMAMLSVGHMPSDDTKEGEALRKAIDFVIKAENQDKDGYFGAKDGSRMYGHGIVTLMLSEVVGMTTNEEQDKTIRERLNKAVALILKAQNAPKKDKKNDGGWRYTPDADDADLSVAAWQIIALRAASNAGIEVPKPAIDRAMAYCKRCYHADRRRGAPQDEVAKTGHFTYDAGGGDFRWGSAAAGLLVLQICGDYDSPEVVGAADTFLNYDIPSPDAKDVFYYYGLYYYAQGMFQRGGDYAEHAKTAVRERLLSRQTADGSWDPAAGEPKNRVYATAMSLLSMSIHYHFLPIYQR
jgi:hypothetical protein